MCSLLSLADDSETKSQQRLLVGICSTRFISGIRSRIDSERDSKTKSYLHFSRLVTSNNKSTRFISRYSDLPCIPVDSIYGNMERQERADTICSAQARTLQKSTRPFGHPERAAEQVAARKIFIATLYYGVYERLGESLDCVEPRIQAADQWRLGRRKRP